MKDYDEKQFFLELIDNIIKTNPNKTQLNSLKTSLAKKYNLKRMVKNTEIIANSPPKCRQKVIQILNIKPVRELSGVTVLALFAKPHKCPHGKCIYCPGGLNSEFGDTPQSYTGFEPAAMRAIRNKYDPYLQVFNRLEHYVINGHLPDKIELIFMGGTFPSLDKEYRDEFVYYTYKAINDFGELFLYYDKDNKKQINYEKFNKFFEVGSDFQSKAREEKILKKVEGLKNKKVLKIGVDIDEVLAEFLATFLLYYEKRFGIKHNIESFKSYDWSTVFNNSMSELVQLVQHFYSEEEYDKLSVVKDSIKILKSLSANNKLYVITSRLLAFKKITLEWLNKNYGDIFEDVIFSNNAHTRANEGLTKSQICKVYNLDIHIEDVFTYAKECSENGTKVFLYDRPWNRGRRGNDNIKRVKSWKEIEREIKKLKEQKEYNAEIKKCEKGIIRPIGLTIETKPDWAQKEHLIEMLEYGATRLEIGVQSLDDEVLKKVNRGHGVKEIEESFRVAKDMCFKINAHMMIGLPFSNLDKDEKCLIDLFKNDKFRPDMLKIYPCLLTKGTGIFEMYKKGLFKPISTKDASKVIANSFRHFPRYVRVMRVQRDIPTNNIIEGIENSNLRQLVDLEINRDERRGMREERTKIREIRSREIGLRQLNGVKPGKFGIKVEEYKSSFGKDFFIDVCDENDSLIGFIRLRFPSKYGLVSNIEKGTALIRELHVYGSVASVGEDDENKFQHKGWGKKLLQKAEEIAKENGFKKIAVISGVGVREYYEKQGYKLEGYYMCKEIGD